jgi:DNA-binding transcriptional LysR family regulator
METKWLEDFVSLAETRSFSRSAQLRHVTQPAFSRRIQALEAWAGTDLVDRSSYPTRLTPAGETLYAQSLEMLQALQSTRAMLRGHAAAGQDVIEFAVPHTLAFTFFPAWVSSLREKFGPIKSRLIALNVHDAAMRLVEGSCDVLIAYHHPRSRCSWMPTATRWSRSAPRRSRPYCKPDAAGRTPVPPARPPGAAAALPRVRTRRLPRARDRPAAQAGRHAIHLDRVYETDMAEGLKVMALEGHGIAFLPHSAVRKELRAGKLVSPRRRSWRAWRSRWKCGPTASGRAAREAPKPTAQALWTSWRASGSPRPCPKPDALLAPSPAPGINPAYRCLSQALS